MYKRRGSLVEENIGLHRLDVLTGHLGDMGIVELVPTVGRGVPPISYIMSTCTSKHKYTKATGLSLLFSHRDSMQGLIPK